jgi:Domain of unknown function (DUF5916)
MRFWLLCLVLLVPFLLLAQAPKQVQAFSTDQKITVDGKMEEPAWQQTQVASGFIERTPNAGIVSPSLTEVRVLYTREALYVYAYMRETKRDSVSAQYNLRDQLNQTDWFMVVLDCFRDGTNGYGFAVSPVGVQADLKFLSGGGNGEDYSWDAVWQVETMITEEGWFAEFEIPYSALRFNASESSQFWLANFNRYQNQRRELSSWNEVDPSIPGVINQSGHLTGLSNLHPPIRLQLTPYLAGTVQSYSEPAANIREFGNSLNGGLDIKYGLSDAFTLDMTLVPDFGQVRFDDRVLNLSPFEVRFNENRPFFTEGAEIFNKTNLFYSRRIGGAPINFYDAYNQLADGETITDNPSVQSLYNATKISGRTKNKTGLGFFNAVAAPTYATVSNATGNKRTIETAPLTNYNVLVFDQTLPNNSVINIVNTSVFRQGSTYDAICAAAFANLRDKPNKWALQLDGAFSNKLSSAGADIGGRYGGSLARTAGKVQGGAGYFVETHNYDPNDLGFLYSPNEKTAELWLDYQIFQPWKHWNNFEVSLWSNYSKLQKPDVFSSFNLGGRAFLLTKKILAYGGSWDWNPVGTDDYFEPRTSDFSRKLVIPSSFNVSTFISTDYRKVFAFDAGVYRQQYDENARYELGGNVSFRIRPNTKWLFVTRFAPSIIQSDLGWIFPNAIGIGHDLLEDTDIIMGRRNWKTNSLTTTGQYIINNRMGVNLRLRHYWANVEYTGFEKLQADGKTAPSVYLGRDAAAKDLHSTNFNAFNLDLVYQWRFAPGSDLILTWKYNIFNGNDEIKSTYLRNLTNVGQLPQTNSLQLKFLYFVDYARVMSRLQG